VDIILSYVDALPMPAHPMIPVLQVSDTPHPHIDVHEASALLDTMIATLSREYTPKAMQSGNINFQVTRGLLGVSL
jgi:hypothetical protein